MPELALKIIRQKLCNEKLDWYGVWVGTNGNSMLAFQKWKWNKKKKNIQRKYFYFYFLGSREKREREPTTLQIMSLSISLKDIII